MATIVTRAGKGSPLTNNEVDQNFINLNTDKLEGTVAIASGGTGQTTQQAAINALAGAVTTGQYLRGNGTNVVMSAIQAGDVPTLNQNTTGTAANVTGTVAIANGGTGQTTKTAAFDALSPATTKGDLIAFDGTDNVRLGVGTNDFVLTADSTTATGLAWKAAAGGSSVLTISNKTAAYTVVAGDLGTIINCTSGTFTVSLTAAATLGAGFNCWIWNTGTGVITIDPNASETIDGATTWILREGEGLRIICNGTNWETGDKKTMRGFAERIPISQTKAVASGSNSIAIGTSRATGTGSFAAAQGTSSTSYNASNSGSVAVGQLTNSTGSSSIALGNGASATNSAAICIGGGQATQSNAVSIASGLALAANSVALGIRAQTTEIGKFAYGPLSPFTWGSTQLGVLMLYTTTADATPKVITSDNSTAAANNQLALPSDSAYHFRISVVARGNATNLSTDAAAYEFTGLIRRATAVGTTTLLASTKTVVFESVPGWDCNISADTTNGALSVTVTGAASSQIRWVARIDSTEINSFLE